MTFLWGTYTVWLQSRAWRETASAESHWLVCGVWLIIGNPNLVSVAWEEGKIFETSHVFYDHSLQSQQPSSTCEVCVCVLGDAGVWAALGVVPRALYILTKLSTTELHSQLPMDRIPFHCPGWSWNSSCSSNRPTSHDPPASASQVAGIKGLHYQV